jgi:hypothetical protein
MDTLDVRQAMLDSLGYPAPPGCNALAQRIRYAGNTQQLWHLRGELMQALALQRGEGWAAGELGRITQLFDQGLPRGLASCVRSYQPRV